MIEDNELLKSYVEKKSQQAFAQLVSRYINLVYASALRKVAGDIHMAEDVTQLVFAALARSAVRLREYQVLAGWLQVTTRNIAAHLIRTECRRKLREQESFLMNEIPDYSHAVNWEQLRPVIDDILAALPVKDREAVLLRFFENRPLAEVGAKLLLTENAARMRVDRALERMRGLLTKRGVTSTVTGLAVVLANQPAMSAPFGLAAKVTEAAFSVSASATGITALLAFMKLTKITVTAAVVAGIIAIGVAVNTFREKSPYSAAASTPQPKLRQDDEVLSRKQSVGPIPSTGAPAVARNSKLTGLVRMAREQIDMTDDEAALIDKNYREMVAARQTLELSLAQREVIDENVVVITIPEYFVEGTNLYKNFVTRSTIDLGSVRAQQILKAIDSLVRAQNRQFGVDQQQMLVEDRGDDIRILHGSGGVVMVNGQPNFLKVSTTSQLRPDHLLTYEYLKPLFPVSRTTRARSN